MTALWVTLGIAAFFLLLFSLRIGIDADFDPKPVVRAGAGGIFRQIYPRRRKIGAKPKKKRPKRAKKPAEPEKPAEKAPPVPLSDRLLQITALLRAVRRAVRPLFRAIHLSVDVSVAVASDDACRTAKEYGAICAALSVLTPALYQVFSVHDCSIRVDADFTGTRLRARGHIRITTTLGGIAGAGLIFLFTWLRVRPKKTKGNRLHRKDNQNERASDQRHDGAEPGQDP